MLSPADIDHFLTYGFVKVEGCIDPDFCAQQVAGSWERTGCDPADPRTWTADRNHLSTKRNWKVAEIAPRAHAAIGQLCGGHERIVAPQWGDGFIVNFNIGAGQPWADPSPASVGWHKDGDFFRHFLDSPEQGLLTIVIWQDVASRGGATFIAADSVGHVARWLVKRPEGVLPNQFPTKELIGQCRDFREAVGQAGDVYLLHPFMLHASSPNHSGRARFITNPPVHFVEPMRFAPPRSPVELAICRALGGDRLDFSIAGERVRIVPERIRLQAEREAEVARRRVAGTV